MDTISIMDFLEVILEIPPPDKWLDLWKFLRRILPDYCEIEAVKYFTAKSVQGESRPRQRAYWRGLRETGVQIIEGTYNRRGKPKEKQTDVNLASHILLDCFFRKEIEVIAVVSNDSDFKLPITEAKETFKKKVFVFSPQRDKEKDNCGNKKKQSGKIIKVLKDAASPGCSFQIDHKLLAKCQFPDVVKERDPRIERPKEWRRPL